MQAKIDTIKQEGFYPQDTYGNDIAVFLYSIYEITHKVDVNLNKNKEKLKKCYQEVIDSIESINIFILSETDREGRCRSWSKRGEMAISFDDLYVGMGNKVTNKYNTMSSLVNLISTVTLKDGRILTMKEGDGEYTANRLIVGFTPPTISHDAQLMKDMFNCTVNNPK